MKYVSVFLFLTVSSFGYCQELGKCAVLMVNWKPFLNKIYVSENDKYIVKLSESHADIFEYDGESYLNINRFELQERYPSNLLVTNAGNILVYGQERLFGTGKAQSDKIYLYKEFGEKFEVIDSDFVFSKDQLKKSLLNYELSDHCTPEKPWVCHSEKPELLHGDEIVTVYDTLGRGVNINLNNLSVETWETNGKCSMFNNGT